MSDINEPWISTKEIAEHLGATTTTIHGIEPYSTPNLVEQNLLEMLEAVSFADKLIFGRTNYSKEITAYKKHKEFYNTQAKIVIGFCEKTNIAYHIKDGTMTEVIM